VGIEARSRGRVRRAIAHERLATADVPAVYTSFVGRDSELAALTSLLRDRTARVVTLTGPGGVGKTRLAVRAATIVADTFPDGVAFTSLASIRDVSLVPRAIARSMGIVGSPDRPIEDQLAVVLHDRDSLVVLDGFEHVLAAAPAVSALTDNCPRLTLLVTSRARLNLSLEHEVQVGPFAVDTRVVPTSSDAVRLFVERAAVALPGFGLTDANAGVIAETCRRLDGLPLAIELAAARVRLLDPAELLSRLERRLPVLAEGPRDRPERHRTLQACVRWSYDLLGAEPQRLLRRVAVFEGGFTLAGAGAVAIAERRPGHAHLRPRGDHRQQPRPPTGFTDRRAKVRAAGDGPGGTAGPPGRERRGR
jgi:predicted ATPase